MSATMLQNLEKAILKSQSDTNDSSDWIADLGCSEKFGPRCVKDIMPCLTKSIADRGGFWLVKRDDFTSDRELLRCQGFDPNRVTKPYGVPAHTFRQMIGNAFTVTVFEALFQAILPSVGL